MTTAAPSTALAAIQPAFTDAERVALAGYRGLTREAYALDLHQADSTSGLGSPTGHALISLISLLALNGLNGLRVSEATGADIEHLGLSAGTGR